MFPDGQNPPGMLFQHGAQPQAGGDSGQLMDGKFQGSDHTTGPANRSMPQANDQNHQLNGAVKSLNRVSVKTEPMEVDQEMKNEPNRGSAFWKPYMEGDHNLSYSSVIGSEFKPLNIQTTANSVKETAPAPWIKSEPAEEAKTFNSFVSFANPTPKTAAASGTHFENRNHNVDRKPVPNQVSNGFNIPKLPEFMPMDFNRFQRQPAIHNQLPTSYNRQMPGAAPGPQFPRPVLNPNQFPAMADNQNQFISNNPFQQFSRMVKQEPVIQYGQSFNNQNQYLISANQAVPQYRPPVLPMHRYNTTNMTSLIETPQKRFAQQVQRPHVKLAPEVPPHQVRFAPEVQNVSGQPGNGSNDEDPFPMPEYPPPPIVFQSIPEFSIKKIRISNSVGIDAQIQTKEKEDDDELDLQDIAQKLERSYDYEDIPKQLKQILVYVKGIKRSRIQSQDHNRKSQQGSDSGRTRQEVHHQDRRIKVVEREPITASARPLKIVDSLKGTRGPGLSRRALSKSTSDEPVRRPFQQPYEG